jgi:multiple sugar transport system permease protein
MAKNTEFKGPGAGPIAVSTTVRPGSFAWANRLRPAWWNSLRRSEVLSAYLLVAPSMVGLLVFSLGALVYALFISFTKWDLITPPEWVGLGNFARAFTDDFFWKSLSNTAYYTFTTVPGTVVLALVLAMAMNQKLAGISIFRAICFLPAITSTVVLALLWSWIYYPDFGVLDYLLSRVGLPAIPWLTSSKWAMPALIILAIWSGVGYYMTIILAGLQGIPQELYDAAKVDGAGPWPCFRHVTIPMLSPVLFFVVVLALIWSFQVFAASYIMTAGGPLNSTLTMVLHIYQNGFQFFRMGYAAALAFILGVIIFAFTLFQFRLQNLWVHYD